MEIIILEKIYVKIKIYFIICQSSGFLLQILNGWIPYVIIILFEEYIGENKLYPINKNIKASKNVKIKRFIKSPS